jgi:hypothetical protein
VKLTAVLLLLLLGVEAEDRLVDEDLSLFEELELLDWNGASWVNRSVGWLVNLHAKTPSGSSAQKR